MPSYLLVLLASWRDRPFESTSLIIAVFLATIVMHGYISKRHLPPGPRRLPPIGNMLQYPSKTPWIRFAEWSKEFGSYCLWFVLYGLGMLICGQRTGFLLRIAGTPRCCSQHYYSNNDAIRRAYA